MSNLNFQQFQQSKVLCTWGVEKSSQEGLGDKVATVFVYDDDCFIEIVDEGSYFLIIGNQEWLSPDLQYLESVLFNDWYLQGA